MNIDLCESIQIAIHDYQLQHNGEKPAKIVMSIEACRIMLWGNYYWPENQTCFGIPVQRSGEEGVRVYLCEPAIQLYPERNPNTIVFVRRQPAEVEHDN